MTTFTDKPCLDCDRITSVADDEPAEAQRCIAHWVAYLRDQMADRIEAKR